VVVQKVEKKQAEKLINSEMQMTLYIKCPACLSDNIKKNGFKSYTPAEPVILPFKPIDRLLKADC